MDETWQDRIEAIANNLLTLEINTAIKPGMVAQKMPELPVALHVIIDTYRNYLRDKGPGGKDPLSWRLLAAAAAHITNDRAVNVAGLSKWFTDGWRPSGSEYVPEDAAAEVTNGAETLEALQWAAYGLLATRSFESATDDPPEKVVVLLSRIRSNSRQLRAAALTLERQFGPGRYPDLFDKANPGMECDARLQEFAKTRKSGAGTGPLRLFGGTLEQTADALFKHPRPAIRFTPDLTLLVRKAWDVGLKDVKFQTVIQLDGDVLVRVAEHFKEGQREFLEDLHRQAVQDATSHWRLLFQTVGELVRETGQLLFGRSRAT